MSNGVQEAGQELSVFEKLMTLIDASPTATGLLQAADDKPRLLEKLQAHADKFNDITDKMAAASAFGQDPDEGQKPRLPEKLRSKFVQAAFSLRRDLPEMEQLPYSLQKLATEVGRMKASQASQLAETQGISTAAVLRRDAGVEIVVISEKKVEAVKHPTPQRQSGLKP